MTTTMSGEICKMQILAVVVIAIFSVGPVLSKNNESSKPTTTATTTTMSPEQECNLNHNCSFCLKISHCLWCNADDKCKQYPTGHIIPRHEDCPLDDARWLVCWLNLKILIIVMSCLAGVILITLGCCIYCCCCRTNKSKMNRKLLADDTKVEMEKADRKSRNDDKRAERKVKTDEIRRKYGLMKEDTPYQRFDA